ncbi:hypothetical protein CANCADRAFT_20522, partial [Tortispora caseinolytica NRRL Y-17796]
QREKWSRLKSNLTGYINRVDRSNVTDMAMNVFRENIIRGKGLYCEIIMKAQREMVSLTPVYACLTAIINTRIPEVAILLIHRLLLAFKSEEPRPAAIFLAHLYNYAVVDDLLILEMASSLLCDKSDQSLDVLVDLLLASGAALDSNAKSRVNSIYDQLRSLLNTDQTLSNKLKTRLLSLFEERKSEFARHPAIESELDLIEEDDQIRHRIQLTDLLDSHEELNEFKFDPDFDARESEYENLVHEIIEPTPETDNQEGKQISKETTAEPAKSDIIDMTGTQLTNFKKTVYLTMMSSIDFEECCHKLLGLKIPKQYEYELVKVIFESCAQEKVYSKYYGLIAERFCQLRRSWRSLFEQAFREYYTEIHRYDTSQLRNLARIFAYILATDALPWTVMSEIEMSPETTNPSSRVFLKFLFQNLQEEMGMSDLKAKFYSEELAPYMGGLIPADDLDNLRFSINFFTAINMGPLTDTMRELLAQL